MTASVHEWRGASRMGRGPNERIDGWKSIAAHLGRDRSTAIRWAKERALPVHALPGGKSRTVYALRHELDAWMRQETGGPETGGPETGSPETGGQETGGSDAGAPATAPDAPPAGGSGEGPAPPPAAPPSLDTAHEAPDPAPPPRHRRALLAGGGAIAAGLVALVTTGALERARAPAALDAAATARLVQARDDLATRQEPRLNAALATLAALAARHPDQPRVHEALAEAWLLAREYGSAPDTLAFARARAAAAAARALDPRSGVADRVEGVALYWWDRAPVGAGVAFRRAIAAAPQDPLAHLWYANALADNGEDAAAAREFTAARMLLPGAPYLLADYAWGLWSAGQEGPALAQLTALAGKTDLASVPDCLSVIALARGDIAGYARQLRARAAIRRHAELVAYSAAIDRALALGGGQGRRAAYAVMLSRAISLAENSERPDHSWPAFVAHAAGDRAQLVAILRTARARGEHWGAAGFVRRMRARWAGDRAILSGLDALAQPRVEPTGIAR